MSSVYNRLSEGQLIPGEGGRDSTADSRIYICIETSIGGHKQSKSVFCTQYEHVLVHVLVYVEISESVN